MTNAGVPHLVVVGDALLDRDVHGDAGRLAPDAPVPVVDEHDVVMRPGGAGLVAVLAAADGVDVSLVTALGDDDAGHALAHLLRKSGVRLFDLGSDGATAEKTRVLAGGRPLLRLDRGVSGRPGPLDDDVRAVIAAADAVVVSDYGRGVTNAAHVRSVLADVAAQCPVVWDPHPRGSTPIAEAALVTPNRSEARALAGDDDDDDDDAHAGAHRAPRWCRRLLARWAASAVVVKLGAHGAMLLERHGRPLYVPPIPAPTTGARYPTMDTCGAGDRFASCAATLLARGASTTRAVVTAVGAASAFVFAGAAGSWPTSLAIDATKAEPNAAAVVARVRARGGRVVATGGCFDVLHAGHVQLLTAARALGDCLIVCLNSDASVRNYKGPGRPVHSESDRRAVLLALACVDAVVVFDDDTPARALAAIAPDVWVKADDYAGRPLPEELTVAKSGGEAVLVPSAAGLSTTRVVQAMQEAASDDK